MPIWQSLEQEDRERRVRGAIIAGGSTVAISLIAGLVCLALGQVDRLWSPTISLMLGLLILPAGLWQHRQRP